MNNWVLFVVLYLIFGVLFDQSYKIVTKRMKNSGAMTVLLELFAALIVIALIPFFEIKFPTDIKIYIFLGMSIIFYAITDRLNTVVRSGLESSTFSIIRQLSTVFMTFAGFLFFKEEFIISKCIGALLIIVSNIIIFYKKGSTGKVDKYLILGIISNICYTIALFLDVNNSENFNLPFYVMISLGIPALLIFIIERVKIEEIKNEFKNGNKLAIFSTSVSWSFSIVAQLRAYQLGNVSVIAPLCTITVILNVIVGYFFLKEKDNLIKKVLAACLIILGIILIK